MIKSEAEWLSTNDVLAMLDHLRADDPEARSVGVYASRWLHGRKLNLWAAHVLGWQPCDIMSVRGMYPYPNAKPDKMTIRLVQEGNNGDCDNFTVDVFESKAADLLREVVGNPFDRQGILNTNWLRSWSEWFLNNPDVSTLAHAASVKHDFSALPPLADALEDAGLDHDDAPALLAHLRSKGPHVEGCWALDAVLGL